MTGAMLGGARAAPGGARGAAGARSARGAGFGSPEGLGGSRFWTIFLLNGQCHVNWWEGTFILNFSVHW